MNAAMRQHPQREMLIEDLELKSPEGSEFASIIAVARFYEDGTPYLYEAIEMDTGKSLSLPSSYEALIERMLEERYAPRALEEA